MSFTKFDVPDPEPEGYLLLGDPSAVPAINAILDVLPRDARVVAILEIIGDGDETMGVVVFVAEAGAVGLSQALHEPGWPVLDPQDAVVAFAGRIVAADFLRRQPAARVVLEVGGDPVAIAYGRNHKGIMEGKLKGVIATVTPSGWRIIISSIPLETSSRL